MAFSSQQPAGSPSASANLYAKMLPVPSFGTSRQCGPPILLLLFEPGRSIPVLSSYLLPPSVSSKFGTLPEGVHHLTHYRKRLGETLRTINPFFLVLLIIYDFLPLPYQPTSLKVRLIRKTFFLCACMAAASNFFFPGRSGFGIVLRRP